MKKTICTIFAAISFIFSAFAQNPDFSFENWLDAAPPFATVDDPVGWASLNALTAVGTDTSVFKVTVGPAAGAASVKIRTVKVVGAAIPNPFAPGDLDTAGLLVIGKINISPPGIKYGYNYTWRSAVLSFQSKYTPMPGDSAFVLVTLTKWNGTSRDTIADGKYATGASTSTYSLNSINLTFNPSFATVVPDSERIFISSSIYSHPGAKIGSAFYIDDMAWSGYNSINDIDANVTTVSVYPNPANNNISFTCAVDASVVVVNDITGRLIGSYSMINNKTTVLTETFAAGTYIYTVTGKNKEVLNRGKFEIVK